MSTTINRSKAPEFHQITEIKVPKIEKGHLANNIPYSIMAGGSQEIVYIELTFNAGTVFSNQLLIASTTNMMLVEGTSKHSAQQIADTFDFYGAEIRTDNNFDSATVGLFCLNKYLDKVLPLFCEIITDSIFPKHELSVVIDERKHIHIENNEKTSVLANDAMHKLVFGNHPYAIRAELPDYDKVTSEILKDFHKRHYNASNCRLLINGFVTSDVISKIEDTIGQLPTGKAFATPLTPIINASASSPLIIKKQNAVQSSLRMGMQTINMGHSDYHRLNMLTTILGGYFGSRLMSNIREEKGYTYGIYAHLYPQVQCGMLRIAGDVKTGYSLKVADEVKKEMQRLMNEPVGNDELALVRNYMMGELLQLFDGPFNCTDTVAKLMDMGLDIDFFEKEQQTILSTTAQELQETANLYFDLDKLHTAIAGNE